MLIFHGRRRGGDLLAFSPDGRALAARSELGGSALANELVTAPRLAARFLLN
jgi:hypothetical protein